MLRYVQEYAHWAKLTDVAPVHRMAKAVAIVPVGHDFPPFSANKGGSIDGSKLFLLTFDLAFQIQEQLRALEAGGDVPSGIGKRPRRAAAYITLLKRLLRQWAIPPARQFNRLPSRARVVTCAGLVGVWQYSRGVHAGVSGRRPACRRWPIARSSTIPRRVCAAADRHGARGAAHRRAHRAAHRGAQQPAGRDGALVPQHLKAAASSSAASCLSDNPEAAAAASEERRTAALQPVVVLPEDADAPAAKRRRRRSSSRRARSRSSRRSRCTRGNETGFAVLTKLVEQGPGFELYEFVSVA